MREERTDGHVVELASGAAHPRPGGAAVTLVVPVYNEMRSLPRTLPAFVAAARRAGAELVFADHGSSDGSWTLLQRHEGEGVRVLRLTGGTIASLRNRAARAAAGEYLAFVDADCLVGEDYVERALETLRETGAAATGCEVGLAPDPHWIEAAWDFLHRVERDRWVPCLNSGNFFVARAAFGRVGGFREELVTDEDYDIGHRMTAAGLRIYACTRVSAAHLGAPRSIRAFYRRIVWHGLGMFAAVGRGRVDRPLVMTALHGAATLAGAGLFLLPAAPPGARAAGALLLQAALPAATVAYRWRQTGRTGFLFRGIALYWLYYWAKLHALALIATGRGRPYR